MSTKICIIDDEHYTLDFFEALLTDEDCTIYKYQSATDFFNNVDNINPDLVISDVVMPGMDGLELLDRLRVTKPEMTVILMTAYVSIEKAVEAIKKGAYDFITKPFDDIDEVLIKVKKALENSCLKSELMVLHENINELYGIDNIVAKSKKMHNILAVVKKVAKINSNVLVTGESGTGKELIARAIHQMSLRKNRRFLPINCAAIPEALQESLFFGYEKGAFTGANSNKNGYFEEADGGTLFLDEIGETSLAFQAKLLRVIQDKKVKKLGSSKYIDVDVRIVCATNLELAKEVEKGTFRQDLYYRINVIKTDIPPLRDRLEDIPILVDFFIKKYNQEFQKNIKGADSVFYKILYAYTWPGNVRELENAVERCMAFEEGKFLQTDYLPAEILGCDVSKVSATFELDYKSAKNRFEKDYLDRILESTGGNILQASKLAKIDPATLHRKINKYLKK